MAIRVSPWALVLLAVLGTFLIAAAWWAMTADPGPGGCGPSTDPPAGGGGIVCAGPQERAGVGLPLFWTGAALWLVALAGSVLAAAQARRPAPVPA